MRFSAPATFQRLVQDSVLSAWPQPGAPIDELTHGVQVAGMPSGLLDDVQNDSSQVDGLRRQRLVPIRGCPPGAYPPPWCGRYRAGTLSSTV